MRKIGWKFFLGPRFFTGHSTITIRPNEGISVLPPSEVGIKTTLTAKQTFAYNAYFCAVGGKPPFYENCIYGTNSELRGYTAGRYLDPYMVATQFEYRLVLPKRFGLVAFGGIGEVASGGGQLFRSNQILPAGGSGVRFMLSKQYHVNLRADNGEGKNGHTFSMGIGEAF